MKNPTQVALNLQIFAEGGTGAAAAEGGEVAAPQTKGVKNPLADVQYGKAEEVPEEAEEPVAEVPVDRKAEFEKLIKNDYKDLYDSRVQDIVQRRLKGQKEIVDKYNALGPVLSLLEQKYGTKPGDIDGLSKAINDDDTYFENEALEKGVTVEQLKEIRRIENENATLKAQMREAEARENADRIYAGWMEQEKAAKVKYPSLDLRAELQNEQFTSLLRSGIDVETAYTVVHKDEIIPAAMQFATQTAKQQVANSVMAGKSRPKENGAGAQSAAVVKSDVSQLTKADRDEIVRRVARGEKIRF